MKLIRDQSSDLEPIADFIRLVLSRNSACRKVFLTISLEWAYQIEVIENGCLVTESWTDMRTWLQVKIGWIVSGVADRATHNLKSMEETLENLSHLAEAK